MPTESEETIKSPAQDVSPEERVDDSVKNSDELSKSELEDVSGGLLRI
jgi:hypothetical protein